ncbi:MAG: NYN domain-containing protein [Oceanospirillaceae bacterium]
MQKIAIFVDVQNIYYTTRSVYKRQFNYRRFWQQINAQGNIVQAIAYATDKGDDGQAKFQTALKHIGFEVKLKPYIQRADGSAKGDWDVGITIDIMSIAPDVDRVILLSGDGDFAILLDKINELHNTQTQVYGVTKLTAKGLIDSCQAFHEITMADLL